MSDSNSSSAPETTSNTSYVDDRVGIDGQNNRSLAAGSTDLGGGIQGGSAPVAAASYQDTGDVFNPQFNFGGVDERASAYDMYQNPQSSIYSGGGLPAGSFGGNAPTNPAGGDFGGAADRGGIVSGGPVSGAVASGEGSISQQAGNGGAAVAGGNFGMIVTAPVAGPVIGGDVLDSAIISAPVTGTVIGGDNSAPIVQAGSSGGVSAPIVGGGDVDIGGPVITGNNAPVTITDASPEIAAAAFASNEATSKRALDLADKSLATVAASVRDPSAQVSSDAMKTLALVAGVVGLVAYFSQKKAA